MGDIYYGTGTNGDGHRFLVERRFDEQPFVDWLPIDRALRYSSLNAVDFSRIGMQRTVLAAVEHAITDNRNNAFDSITLAPSRTTVAGQALTSADVGRIARAIRMNPSEIHDLHIHGLMDDRAMAALVQTLGPNSQIRSLDLSDNTISDASARLLANALRSNSSLQELDLSRAHLSSEAVTMLIDAMKQNQTLQGLRVNRERFGTLSPEQRPMSEFRQMIQPLVGLYEDATEPGPALTFSSFIALGSQIGRNQDRVPQDRLGRIRDDAQDIAESGQLFVNSPLARQLSRVLPELQRHNWAKLYDANNVPLFDLDQDGKLELNEMMTVLKNHGVEDLADVNSILGQLGRPQVPDGGRMAGRQATDILMPISRAYEGVHIRN